MKIGFCTNPRKDLLKEISWIGRNGFDFVDLFLEEDKATPERIDVEKVKELLRKYSLGVMGHTEWYIPLGSPAKILREAAVQEAVRYFETFSRLGAEFVTAHANWPGILFSAKEGVNFQAESLKVLVERAGEFGLKLMYELADTQKDSVKNIGLVLKKVPGLYFHLDMGHANLYKRKPEHFIKKFHAKLRHVHMHDNHGEWDEHLPLGKGSIDWEKTIRALKKYYDGAITLEVFHGGRRAVLSSREKLKKIWESV